MLYSLARPMLFSLAPERAHELTLSMLDKAHKLGMMRQTVEAKPTTCMGIEFPNPVGLAAGLDKNGAHIDALAGLVSVSLKLVQLHLAHNLVTQNHVYSVFLKLKLLLTAWVLIMMALIS